MAMVDKDLNDAVSSIHALSVKVRHESGVEGWVSLERLGYLFFEDAVEAIYESLKEDFSRREVINETK